jgi:hypothetical protein
MCEQDIESAVPKERKPKPPDPPPHLAFCILVVSWFVAHRSAKSKYTHAFIDINFVFDADTALWRMRLIFVIMVAADIEDGSFGKGDQKGEIIRIEISCRENQVNTIQTSAFIEIPEIFGLFIRND